LTVSHLPARLGAGKPRLADLPKQGVAAAVAASPPAAAPPVANTPLVGRKPVSLREIEMQAILEGLERNHGNKARTAEELGISLKTLYNKLHQLQDGAVDRTA
jgi:DNA-binding NtrC family response regulator